MPILKVGHKGADAVVPGNTPASFDAALAVGVDMIEFDVLEVDGRLVLAHDFHDARKRTPTTLEQGLDHLAASAFAGLDLDVDLKLPGYEERVLDRAARARPAAPLPDLHAVRRLARRHPAGRAERAPGLVGAQGLARLHPVARLRRAGAGRPARLPRGLPAPRRPRAARAPGATRSWPTGAWSRPALVRAVRGAGGELYVWTVDELERIAQLEALGVTGVITNDPRLFARVGVAA